MPIVAASHTAELAERFGRRVRNIINEHSATLGLELAPDIQAAGQWETTQGGEYFAVGVLGAVTGRRADIVIIDDPVKSRLEADSETVRERVWEWWKADLLTRLKPGAKIVLVMTRWHEDDLGGRLLAEMEAGGRKWEVLRLPMEAEAGRSARPRAGRAAVAGVVHRPTCAPTPSAISAPGRRCTSRRRHPTPASTSSAAGCGLPCRCRGARTCAIYGASDYAVTADGGDWTVHVVIGMDPDDRLWLLDLWRGQTASDVWIEAFCDMVRQWKPVGMGGGAGADQGGHRAVPRSSPARAAGVRGASPVPDAWRQGGAGAVDPGAHGAGRAALPCVGAVACGVRGGADERSLPASTTTRSMRSVSSGSCWTSWCLGRSPQPPEPPRDSWDIAFERANWRGDYESWRVV